MVIIYEDKKLRKVKLTGDEIDMIIELFEREPHNIFVFYEYDKLIERLKKAKKLREK